MEDYQFSQGKVLRCGYTTGSCATAASKAAATMLLTGERVETVRIDTPKGIVLDLEPLDVEMTPDYVSCAIRKDSGDDPDDTNGVLVYARAERTDGSGIELEGGVGVGRVTKPGLACAVGGPAINPTPRRMITQEVGKAMEAAGYNGGMKLTISIPAGVEIAKKTFNPRLGIIGGLSVLGTSGIVEPMSEKALIETMYVEIRAQKARGNKNLLVFFGNYGEDFTRDEMKLDLEGHVTCSNFVGELLDYAVYCGFETLLLIGHSGKLVKVAQGVMNTHSKYADCRTELFCAHAAVCGAEQATCQALMNAATTDACIEILDQCGLRRAVFARLLDAIQYHLNRRAAGAYRVGAVLFSNEYGLLGTTEVAEEIIGEWNKNAEFSTE